MLTKVSVENPLVGTLQLPLMDSSGGYVVKDIQGLDPVKATLVSSTLAQMDGAQFHNARREPRNITMKLGFAPDYVVTTVASLRSNLYLYLMPKTTIIFGVYDDDVLWGEIAGIVESFDQNMFSSDPEVNVSIICYDPDFYAPSETTVNANTTSGMTTTPINYPGNSDTGVKFHMTFPAVATGVTLYNTRPDGIIDITTIAGSFLANDQLDVDTNPGSKTVTMTRLGTKTPVLYYLDRMSTWIRLMRGANQFRAQYSGAATAYTLKYTSRFGGF